MVNRRRTQSCILPSNELFLRLACLHISVKGVSKIGPIRSALLLGTYLSVCSGKRFPLSTNQLTDLCDSHAGHIVRGNAILQEKTIGIKGLLDEAIVFDMLICFLGALDLCLCPELVSSVVGVSDLCRCVRFKPLLIGDFVLGLVLMGNVIGTLEKVSHFTDKNFQTVSPTSRSSGVKALYFAALALALSVVDVPLT
jgi:hypothetical protein